MVAASAGALCVTEAGKVQFVMVTLVVAEQPKASVTVKTCTPGPRWNTPVPVYGAVPADAETVTLVLPLKTVTEPADEVATKAEGNTLTTPVEIAVVPLVQPAVTVIAQRTITNVAVGVILNVEAFAPARFTPSTDH